MSLLAVGSEILGGVLSSGVDRLISDVSPTSIGSSPTREQRAAMRALPNFPRNVSAGSIFAGVLVLDPQQQVSAWGEAFYFADNAANRWLYRGRYGFPIGPACDPNPASQNCVDAQGNGVAKASVEAGLVGMSSGPWSHVSRGMCASGAQAPGGSVSACAAWESSGGWVFPAGWAGG